MDAAEAVCKGDRVATEEKLAVFELGQNLWTGERGCCFKQLFKKSAGEWIFRSQVMDFLKIISS